MSSPYKTECDLGSFGTFTVNSINNCSSHGRLSYVSVQLCAFCFCPHLLKQTNIIKPPKCLSSSAKMDGIKMCPKTVKQRVVMDQCECLCYIHVFSQWPSGTWQGSSGAGFRKERPSIWSMMPPAQRCTKVK